MHSRIPGRKKERKKEGFFLSLFLGEEKETSVIKRIAELT
jgi:hypothetical protein